MYTKIILHLLDCNQLLNYNIFMMLNEASITYSPYALKRKVIKSLREQGYKYGKNKFFLQGDDRDTKRKIHEVAKNERLSKNGNFIKKHTPFISQFLISGEDIDVSKISPKVYLVESGTKLDTIFKWWNLVWWSLPYEKAYGRQMRYVIWDEYHNAPIGLIGLQSPILSWNVRDKYLKIPVETRDYWVNQSMSAQRLGSLPPYNYLLGGKLVASLMTTKTICEDFEAKYRDTTTILKQRTLPARLLFITTTGAYGKSSVYTRLKFGSEHIAKFIGYSQGYGSFHIPNALFEELVKHLETQNFDVRRGYGSGPSRKLRLIDNALQSLGIMNGNLHGVQRAVYLFPFVSNLEDVIAYDAEPIWNNRSTEDVTAYWKGRWGVPRAQKNKEYLDFNKDEFINKTLHEIEKVL